MITSGQAGQYLYGLYACPKVCISAVEPATRQMRYSEDTALDGVPTSR